MPYNTSSTYQCISVQDLNDLLIDRWREILVNNDAFRSPYFQPEFVLALDEVNVPRRPEVVVIRQNDRVVGFFPFQRSRLDGGKPVAGALSDYHGVISEPGSQWCPSALLEAAGLGSWSFNHLVDPERRFDPYLLPKSNNSTPTGSPWIDLSSGYERYVEERRLAGSDYIPKTEALARKLSRDVGQLHFSWHEPNTEVLHELMRWKSLQYRESGLPDAFAAPWTRRLLAHIAKIDKPSFAGVCSVLRAGDDIAAIHFGMRSKNELHYWFPAYNANYSKYSPGIILLLRMAQAAADRGITSVDLGKGDSSYKKRLKSGEVPLGEGWVERPSLVTTIRRWQRLSESREKVGYLAPYIRWPLKAWRRLKWKTMYLD